MVLLRALALLGWNRFILLAASLALVILCVRLDVRGDLVPVGGLPGWIVNVSWGAAVVAVFATVHVAGVFARNKGSLFVSLSAFALAWAVLLPYYASTDGTADGILSAFSGCLLIFAGGPLRRLERGTERVHAADRWGLRLLVLLVLPHVLFPPGKGITPEAFHRSATAVLCCLLMLVGLLSITDGVRRIASDDRWCWMLVVVAPYACAEVAFAARLIALPGLPMPAPYRVLFALLKLALTATFTWLVARETPRYRRIGLRALWI